MTPSQKIDAAVSALREDPYRHIYEGASGAWWISRSGPTFSLTKGEVDAMVQQRLIELDFPGFYRLVPVAS